MQKIDTKVGNIFKVYILNTIIYLCTKIYIEE
jgi:hypothetical protein